MHVRQCSIFVENTKGSLAKLTKVLKDNHINMAAATIADTEHFGILRVVFAEPERAVEVLKENGFTTKISQVIGCAVPDRPGGLADILLVLEEADINVEYIYFSGMTEGGEAILIIRVRELEKAQDALKAAGVKLLSHEQVAEGR
ncbi:MAG: ACT domain-containing protein [Christensenellales bacterium]|jgi:hypothetical protein